ncbi:MAG TPA: glycosyltransferase [Vicinamibacterales bacterium]|nr:glycosyltransferase [Vicinamibacterales bacterium]
MALFLPSLAGGGAERVMLNLAMGLTGRGFDVDLLLASAEGAYIDAVPADVRVVDLQVPRLVSAVWPLSAYLRQQQPLVVIAALTHANLAAMIAARAPGARTPIVISIHNTLSKEVQADRTLRYWLIAKMIGRVHHWADSIVAVSGGVADDFARYAAVPRERINVIPNPVITEQLLCAARQPARHAWLDAPTHPVLLGAGRLTRQKNHRALIDAFAVVRRTVEARLVILGEGPERPALEARIRHHGLQEWVALPGFVANPYAWMARASVFVLSSDYEGLPTVLIESLAVGAPVVATDCESGPREILRNGELGELVPVRDVSALSAAILRTLRRSPPVRRSNDLHSYTLDAVVDQFENLIRFHS